MQTIWLEAYFAVLLDLFLVSLLETQLMSLIVFYYYLNLTFRSPEPCLSL